MKLRRRRHCLAMVENLESRVLLSASIIESRLLPQSAIKGADLGPAVTYPISVARTGSVRAHAGSATPIGLTASQIRSAYGLDQIMFGSIVGDGSGQTIAIIDGYHYPTAQNDVNVFSSTFGLPQFNSGAGSPTFTQVNQIGGTPVANATDPAGAGNVNGTWEEEAALDIEWAHAIAPKANIILVECYHTVRKNSYSLSLADLIAGVDWARQQPGVSVISMSFGATDGSSLTAYNTYFTTPAGHSGVTFLASTGDTGQPAGYPATSPNVVAVGGTTLRVNSGDYINETGWSGSGGGVSPYEPVPSYQSSLGYSGRATPDISWLADPNTGVAVYDTWDFGSSTGWFSGTFGGTSLSTPMFAGLMAVANQGRANVSLAPLNGPTQTLPALYAFSASDFYDITSGNNGTSATTGYDLVTGRGTPVTSRLIQDLVGTGSVAGNVFQDNNSDGTKNGTDVSLTGATIYLDSNGNGLRDAGGIAMPANITSKSIPDNSLIGAVSKITVSGIAGPITDVNVSFTIAHGRDSDLTLYLYGPDGTRITLLSLIGGAGANFTGTSLDDEAATAISAGAAPFSGTFAPTGPGAMGAFDGLSANGTWKLIAVDSVSGTAGTISSWSLTLTTGPETGIATDASGNYTLANLALGGNYTIRQVVPTNYTQTSPITGYATTVTGALTGRNFADFPTLFSTSASNKTYTLSLDSATHTKLQINDGTSTYVATLSLLPMLTFNLTGSGDVLVADFSNGLILPTGGISYTGSGTQELRVLGQSSAQSFTMTDTQIGPTGGGAIYFTNISTMTVGSSTVHYSGTFATLENLNILAGTYFYWG